MPKREWVRKATGSYLTYLSLVKLQPWFLSLAVEDLPLGRTPTSVPAFEVKYLPLVRNLYIKMAIVIDSK